MHLDRRHFLSKLGFGALGLSVATTGWANTDRTLDGLLAPSRTL